MNRHNNLYEGLAKRVEAPTMTLIQPTDILLGRGPTCYNNPGNRVFRKVLKEHVVHYRNQALRKEKAALVKMLVSKLEAMGYRFLQRSSTGTWIEAPPQIAENKVGHGLRDLRQSIAKVRGATNVLPKMFHPVITEQKCTAQAKSVITGKAQTTERMCSMKSDNTAAITTDLDRYLDGAPTKLHINAISLKSSANTPFDSTSALQEYPLAKGEREKAEPSSFAYVIDEPSEHRKSGGHAVNTISERRAYGSLFTSDSEMERRLEHSERTWNDIKDTLILPAVSPNTWEAQHDAHGLDSVGVVP